MDETQIVLCPNVQLSSSFGFVSVSIDCSDLKSLRMAMKFPQLWSLDIECKSRISLQVKKSFLVNPEDVLKRHPNFQDRNRGFGYWITLAEAFLGKRLNVTDNNDIVELVNFVKTTLPELLDAEVFNNVPGREGYTVNDLLEQIVDHISRGKILPEECWNVDFLMEEIPLVKVKGLTLAYWNANNDESEFMSFHTLASVRTINETFSAYNNRTANIFYNGHGFATGYVDNVLLREQVFFATQSLLDIMKKFVL